MVFAQAGHLQTRCGLNVLDKPPLHGMPPNVNRKTKVDSSSCVTTPKQSQQITDTTAKTNSEHQAQNISAGPVHSKSGRIIRPTERFNL